LAVFDANWFISGFFVNCGLVLILPLIVPLYRLWTKGCLEFNAPLFFLLAVAIALTNFGAGLNQYLQGINDLRAQVVVTAVRASVLFSLSWLLSDHFGILSVGIGCVAAELFASVLLPIFFVNGRLAQLSAGLPFKPMLLAIIPPSLLLTCAIVMTVRQIDFSTVTLMLIPALCCVYYLNWRALDGEVKTRIWLAARTIIRKVIFSPTHLGAVR
jgi:O-antigen/teichoic acid export membrane protein